MNYPIFHVHTYRCQHAGNEREEAYVKKAVELGAKEIVFTDHAPFPGDPFRFRMTMDELSDYVDTLMDLKVRYSHEIRIKIGLEMEYIPDYKDYYQSLREKNVFDLFLLGPHFARIPDGSYTFDLDDKKEEMSYLAAGIIAGMKSGFFQVVAHPDQIFRRCKHWNEECEDLSADIKTSAVECGVNLEKNIRNMIEGKKKNLYRPEFWTDCPDGLKIIYGVDAHSVAEMEEAYEIFCNGRYT